MEKENELMPELVALDLIDANPWQVRLSEDAGKVNELAKSIAEHGLLQPPTGRRVDGRIQLAFGHTRWSAFRFLNEQFGPAGNGQAGDRFARMPLFIRELDDRTMAEHAIVENVARNDLSDVERATAIRRYIEDFHATQAQAGEKFGLSQSAVAHLLRLLELPDQVKEMVHAGSLAQRYARKLVPVARVAKAEDIVEVAERIAEADEDEREDIAGERINYLLYEVGMRIRANDWPPDWKPDMSADIEGQAETPPACKGCSNSITAHFETFCVRPACYEAKKRLWVQRELARLTKKFGIPAAGEGEAVTMLDIGWGDEKTVRGWLKKKSGRPESLRLMPATEIKWRQRDLLDSPAVWIGSTDPNLLKRAAKAEPGESLDLTPAEQHEAEEKEKAERREQKAAVRRAYYDIAWLIHHTAEACRDQLDVHGAALTWMAELVGKDCHEPFPGYKQYWGPRDKLEDDVEKSVGKVAESLMRQLMLVEFFADGINTPYNPQEMFDWPAALEAVQSVADDLCLKLPKDWNQPPVHKTDANCHVCGRFTSMDHVTKRDEGEGWRVEGELVTCSDECRAKAAKPAPPASGKAKRRK